MDQVTLEVDDRGKDAALIKLGADFVRVQIVHGIAHESAASE